MRTRRGLSVALGLVFVGAAPLVAQQTQHSSGHPHQTDDAVHAYQKGVRQATGPTRFPPAIVGWHTLGVSSDRANPVRRPVRRATGASRFPRS